MRRTILIVLLALVAGCAPRADVTLGVPGGTGTEMSPDPTGRRQAQAMLWPFPVAGVCLVLAGAASLLISGSRKLLIAGVIVSAIPFLLWWMADRLTAALAPALTIIGYALGAVGAIALVVIVGMWLRDRYWREQGQMRASILRARAMLEPERGEELLAQAKQIRHVGSRDWNVWDRNEAPSEPLP